MGLNAHKSNPVLSKSATKETPLMGQYNRIKAKHPDAILLFRVGDFYETFSQDAITTSQVLGIVLTKRSNGAASEVELAGFPHHALETYLPKLVRAGYRVAVCDQLEDPKLAKTIVKRGVTELVTPGVAISDKILDHKTNNFLASVAFDKSSRLGISLLDVSTGEFFVAEGEVEYIENLLQSFQPSEVIFSKSRQKDFKHLFGPKFYIYALEDWIYQYEYGCELLLKQFETLSFKGFGVDDLPLGITAAGACIHYLSETAHPNLKHLTSISRLESGEHVWLDKFTIRNLELIHSTAPDGASLIQTLDKTTMPMGARMLRKWLLMPLRDLNLIKDRHNMVEWFIRETDARLELKKLFRQIGDLERLISRISLSKASPREMVQLRRALSVVEPVRQFCLSSGLNPLQIIGEQLNECKNLHQRIAATIIEEAPAQASKGGFVLDGVSEDLDELRQISRHGKDRLIEIQQTEMQRTGISSLKVGFNNVFGYYLEVTNTHKDKVPPEWVRKQTLVNAERYITDDLKQYEEKILGAEDKILALEERIFNELVLFAQEYIRPIQLNAALLARLDCLLAFAEVAIANEYRKPEVNDSNLLHIEEGRHPVIEKQLPLGEQYVPNDLKLDTKENQILIITGPNMAGKSALLRQAALIVLMAQAGSFVPVKKAVVGLCDRIFTRVGASDNISSGESTFMVEMNETASILNNISERSLILLDEIGRGTSTYDGISIAWAIAEYLNTNKIARPKTLFATHYHELTQLEEKLPGIRNFHVSTREAGGKVIFLRKLAPGGSQRSFGIHVAKMAGMPREIISRANEILEQLEQQHIGKEAVAKAIEKAPPRNYQLSIFEINDPRLAKIRDILQSLDINSLTPIESLLKLQELKKITDDVI